MLQSVSGSSKSVASGRIDTWLYFLISAVFHLNSVGSNMTTLWAAEAGLYVGIDNRGNIVTSVSIYLRPNKNNVL